MYWNNICKSLKIDKSFIYFNADAAFSSKGKRTGIHLLLDFISIHFVLIMYSNFIKMESFINLIELLKMKPVLDFRFFIFKHFLQKLYSKVHSISNTVVAKQAV